MASTSTTAPRRSARDRLLDAANELFYAEGIHTVGVDRIIEHAGVSRGSFYNNFESKEELIHTYLQGRQEMVTGRLTEAIAWAGTPREKILAVFDSQAEQFAQPGFRGCAFVAASAEVVEGSSVTRDSARYRGWLRAMFTELAAQAGAGDPERLGRQLHMLYDGATLTVRMDRDPRAATDTRAAVEVLLAASLP